MIRRAYEGISSDVNTTSSKPTKMRPGPKYLWYRQMIKGLYTPSGGSLERHDSLYGFTKSVGLA